MLTIERVSKRYRSGHFAVRDVSLRIEPGVLGVLGPNGAGKTTLMQMLATVSQPTSGRILFRGTDVCADPDALRRCLGYLPQEFGLYDNLTAAEFLSYLATLRGVRSSKRVREVLEIVHLGHVADRLVGGLSGGMKQRLGIAQALVNDPEVLIVDEPTSGLDPEERVHLRHLLADVGANRLVILSTHIVTDVEAVATQLAIIEAGRLVAVGTAEMLLQQAAGHVWQVVFDSHEFTDAREGLTVSQVTRRHDGVLARVVADERPRPGATLVEPTLEEAYLNAVTLARAAAAGPS